MNHSTKNEKHRVIDIISASRKFWIIQQHPFGLFMIIESKKNDTQKIEWI